MLSWSIVGALVAGIVALVVLIALQATKQAAPNGVPLASGTPTLKNGARLPKLPELTVLGGVARSSLGNEVTGHPAVINFFASWCNACAAELKAFATVSHTQHAQVSFVGIDTNDFDPTRALQLSRAAGAQYPILHDTSSLVAANAFGVGALPMTFFINARGNVVDVVLGKQSTTVLNARVQDLLAGRTPR